MKKIVLLGDSIRLFGYGKVLPGMLGGEYEVWQPDDNGRFSYYTLRGMLMWKEHLEGCDLVHWNNGLWDVCDLFGDGEFTPLEVYVDTMLRIASILQKYSKKVVFATTTPVDPAREIYNNDTIKRYNDRLVPKLKEMGVLIDDLHAVVASDPAKYISHDKIHLSDEGSVACARAAAEVIRSALE